MLDFFFHTEKSPPFCCNLRKAHQILMNPTQES